jgi:glycosyltransferase involved in cell wall biosynthesis
MVGPEAFTNGRPVVAYVAGGVGTWLSDDSGIAVRSGDIAGLAEALRRLLADPALGRSLGEGARARAAQFSIGTFTARTEELLRLATPGAPDAALAAPSLRT